MQHSAALFGVGAVAQRQRWVLLNTANLVVLV